MKYWLVLLLFIMPLQVEGTSQLEPLLNQKEVSYLKTIDSLTVCNVAQATSHTASYELVKLLLKQSNITLHSTDAADWSLSVQNLLNHQCDILPWATKVPERLNIMNFTRPYARIKRVIITQKENDYIGDLSEVDEEQFATLRGNYLNVQIRRTYPKIKLVETERARDVLQMVANNEVYAGFATLYSVANLFNIQMFGQLKIAGILPSQFDDVVSLATRAEDKILIGILEKIIITGDKRAITKFLSKGAITTMEPTINYKEYWMIGIIILLFVLALVAWNRNLTLLNKRLENTRNQLEIKTKELELLSETDTLTQTYNRIKLDQVFVKELERVERYQTPLSIIMIDIDNFKNINDTFGHIAGDQVLSKFSFLMKDNLRGNDVLGRWGGEEFLIICPSTNLSKAEKVAEKLRQLTEKFDFSPVEKMTASFGVTEWVKKDTQETIVSRADYAMYLSKKHGRNTVSISIEPRKIS